MADQLVTTAQVKARDEISDAADDPVLTELIEQVTDWIQDFTGRKFLPANGVTYIVDTAAGSVIDVPIGVRAVTALEIALTDQPDTGGTYTAITAADILLRPSELFRRPGWPATQIYIRNANVGRLASALNAARIVGNFGFAAVPPAIQGVAIDAVVTAFNARQGGASDVIGAGQTAIAPWASFFTEASAQFKILDRYRIGGGSIGIA